MQAASNTAEIIQQIESLIKKAKEGSTIALDELVSLLNNCMEALTKKAA